MEHHIILHGGQVLLRPLTEEDWEVLLKWNHDPELLYLILTREEFSQRQGQDDRERY